MGKIDSQLERSLEHKFQLHSTRNCMGGIIGRFRASGARDGKSAGWEAGDCFNLLAEPCSPFFF